MGKEIERKFLVTGTEWKHLGEKMHIWQGYISSIDGTVVRVRIAGERAYLTVKGKTAGIQRSEFEYPIPVEDARQMLKELCAENQVEKYRYIVQFKGFIWEVDEFLGKNAGLVIAEVELEDENQKPDIPGWIGEEVTGHHRYYNSSLAKHPYSRW